jgi:cell division protein FtsB
MKESTLKLLVKALTALAVVVFVALLVFLTFQYIKLNNLSNTQTALENELINLVEQRQALEGEYNYIDNHYNDYIEDYVREMLGWGRDGEIKFIAT